MLYNQTIRLKNGKDCTLRNAEGSDAEGFLGYFIQCHGETDSSNTAGIPEASEHAPANGRSLY